MNDHMQRGAKPPEGVAPLRQIYFFKNGWRKGRCLVCSCLVPVVGMMSHGIYHVARGEGQAQDSFYHSFIRVTVDNNQTTRTGWVTNDTGPR